MRNIAKLLPLLLLPFLLNTGLAQRSPSSGRQATMKDWRGNVEKTNLSKEQEIAALFDRWNESLQTGDPKKVSANYAENAVLLPTLSSKYRLTQAEREDYFAYFLKSKPSGKIDFRRIFVDGDTAIDTGYYTFTFAATGRQAKARYTFTYKKISGQWLITTHHSSLLPEG